MNDVINNIFIAIQAGEKRHFKPNKKEQDIYKAVTSLVNMIYNISDDQLQFDNKIENNSRPFD